MTKVIYTSSINSNQSTNSQLLINGREKVGIKKLKNSKALIDYTQTMYDVYENLEDLFKQIKQKC